MFIPKIDFRVHRLPELQDAQKREDITAEVMHTVNANQQ
jgi:hypothetical protein